MPLGYARQKVQGGKMLAVKLEYDDRIKAISITGDFFIYPESALAKIESAVVGSDIGEGAAALAERIAAIVKSEGAELVGITPGAIASTIKAAIK